MGTNNDNKNRSILVLSDDLDSIVRRYGQKHAFNVHSFADPSLALRHFRLNYELLKYELVIVDMGTSAITRTNAHMTESDFVRKVREILPTIKILMVSTFEIRNTGSLSPSININGFIQKPLSMEKLQSLMEGTLKLVINPRRHKRTIKRGTSTITFRIDNDVLGKLREESVQEEISLNTFINKILKRYIEWAMFEPQLGMIPLARPVVAEIFRNMSEEEIVNLAKYIAKNAVQDMILFCKGKIDLNSFLSWFELRMKNAFIEINHISENSNKTCRYIMKHDLGENWSFYHKTLLQLIFNDLLGMRIDIVSISDTLLIFQFENNSIQKTDYLSITE
jgi:DNA-binding NarL/FixJ family response regulator